MTSSRNGGRAGVRTWAGIAAAWAVMLCAAGYACGATSDAGKDPSLGAAGVELYCLPPEVLRPDGSFNQEAIVQIQRKRIHLINEKISTRLRLTETPHYLIFSDADAAVTAQFARWGEALFANMAQKFGLDPRERVWDGKCMLILFNHRSRFETYAKTFDGHVATGAGAYFAVEKLGDGMPNMVHMCLPVESHHARRLQELFAHEGTHAFIELYRKPGGVPLWLHEGLAELMTVVNDPALREPKTQPAVRMAALKAPLKELLAAKTGDDLQIEQYSTAYTLVDFLLATGRPKFKKFIEGLKDGLPQEEALQAAYGFGLAELQERWRTHVRQMAPKQR